MDSRRRLLLLLIVFLAAGCRAGDPSGEALEPVVVVGSTWYAHLPAFYAIEAGIFEKYGFSPTYREVIRSSDRVASFASGRVHFGSLGQISMMTALANGNDSFYWVGTHDMAAQGFEGLVGAPGFSSFEQLVGQKIGFPFATTAELTTRYLLKKHGLSADDVEFVNLDATSIPSAVELGSVAAAAVWEPNFSRTKEIPGTTVLGIDVDTVFHERFGTMSGPDVLALSRKWADADPDRAQRFMDAYWEALAAVKEDVGAVLDVVYDKYFTQERRELEANLEKFVWLDRQDQDVMMTEERLYAHTDFLVSVLKDEIGYIEEAPDYRAIVRLELALPR